MTTAVMPATIITELGKEKRCYRCGDYWPADREFFYYRNGKPHDMCRACENEYNAEYRRRRKNK